MLWTAEKTYSNEPFETEKDLEIAILEVRLPLFGDKRIYLDTKKKIGPIGKKQNIPDGYLLDLTSKKEPRLFVVENELAIHDPLKHIAVQILEFSLSFETTPQRVKEIVKAALYKDQGGFQKCNEYASDNGYENIDYLLENMIYRRDAFNALVIIDEVPDELETVLVSRFKFPVEILTLQRYKSPEGDRIYQFEPFLHDISGGISSVDKSESSSSTTVDPSELDTIVVPAREEGFQETFIGEDCWYAIRMHSSMVSRIRHIAAYRVAPISAITHIAAVRSIEQWRDTNKYVLHFAEPAKETKPIKLVPKGRVKAPQAPRYTSLEVLQNAKTLDDAF